MTGGGSAGAGILVSRARPSSTWAGLGASAWAVSSGVQAVPKGPTWKQATHPGPGPALAGSLGAPLNTVNPASFPSRTQVTHPLLAWLVPTLPLRAQLICILFQEACLVQTSSPKVAWLSVR